MNNLFPIERIENKIYFVRGKKVMLDRDLAVLYAVKSRRLREQVKRNIHRFPSDFMFRLTSSEADLMVSQNATPSKQHLGGSLPLVFTEHGALMLASILNSPKAIEVGVLIVRTFVKMRELLSSNKDLKAKVEELEKKYDMQFKLVFDAIKALIEPPPPKHYKIGFLRDRE